MNLNVRRVILVRVLDPSSRAHFVLVLLRNRPRRPGRRVDRLGALVLQLLRELLEPRVPAVVPNTVVRLRRKRQGLTVML